MGLLDLPDQPVPEVGTLGVRVVHAEDLHIVRDPVVHHAQQFRVEAGLVVVEVDRVDVLVLLGRVLRVGDGAVRLGGEPLRVLGHPRVVRRALDRQVERDFQVQFRRSLHERLEVHCGAELRVDRVVPTVGRADRPRRPDVVRPSHQRVVRALAVDRADRMDRRQVHHVEAHRGDAVQRGRRGRERAVHRSAGLVDAAGRAREQLIPGPEQRALAVHEDLVRPAPGDQLADRELVHDRAHPLAERHRHPLRQRAVGVAQVFGGRDQQRLFRAPVRPATYPVQQQRAALQVVGELLRALPDLQLGFDRVQPGRPRIAPRLDAERPRALDVRHDERAETVQPLAYLDHPGLPRHAIDGSAPGHGRGDLVVAIAPDRRLDGQLLADNRLGRIAILADHRHYVVDAQSPSHNASLPSSIKRAYVGLPLVIRR